MEDEHGNWSYMGITTITITSITISANITTIIAISMIVFIAVISLTGASEGE